MRERAKQIGAELTIWSSLGSGTEIELSLPGTTAYTSLPRSLFGFFQSSP
jgi:nitrate/nitrite-specific signal transduction histidine kinase